MEGRISTEKHVIATSSPNTKHLSKRLRNNSYVQQVSSVKNYPQHLPNQVSSPDRANRSNTRRSDRCRVTPDPPRLHHAHPTPTLRNPASSLQSLPLISIFPPLYSLNTYLSQCRSYTSQSRTFRQALKPIRPRHALYE